MDSGLILLEPRELALEGFVLAIKKSSKPDPARHKTTASG